MFIRPIFRQFLSPLKSNKGFSITEVLIAAGLLTIVSVGVTSLMSNMQKEQRRNQLLQVLTSKKLQFENAIRNQSSWSKTVVFATNANMACLRLQVTCDGSNGGATTNMVDATVSTTFVNSSGRDIVLKDGGNNNFYDGRQGSNTAGFRESGEACTGFSYATGSGNDACPIGYVVNWRASSSATNPQIFVSAKLVYNPSDANPFKKFINADTIGTTFGKYDVSVIRTATTTSKSFVVNLPVTTTAGLLCTTRGFGQCSGTANYTGYSEAAANGGADAHDLVTATGGASTTFRVKESGSYKCTVTTYAFATNGVKSELMTGTTALGTAYSMASNFNWGYATVVMETTFNFTAAQDVFLRQTCEVTPDTHAGSPDPNINNCALGFQTSPYSGTPNRASINCVQIVE